ncbi:adenine deaminase [Striga asiatica]|uniref:Adenine deaminase n=1 Tax=Striga asiatica TaxID=4170 RepID=A0A5A7PV25_STRAF|nr:adenine deaminase [Striga asiatica]
MTTPLLELGFDLILTITPRYIEMIVDLIPIPIIGQIQRPIARARHITHTRDTRFFNQIKISLIIWATKYIKRVTIIRDGIQRRTHFESAQTRQLELRIQTRRTTVDVLFLFPPEILGRLFFRPPPTGTFRRVPPLVQCLLHDLHKWRG